MGRALRGAASNPSSVPPVYGLDERGPATRSTSSRIEACPARDRDPESRQWCERLHASGATRRDAIAELHARLRTEAVFQIRQRARGRPGFPNSDIDDLAVQAADDALVAILRKLDQYRGDSHFLTWARGFAAIEAPVTIRRRIGHGVVGVARDPDTVLRVADPARSPHDRVVMSELLDSVTGLMTKDLTRRQRAVLTAIVLNGESPAQLATELNTTTGAIYKTLHDARVKLRAGVQRAEEPMGSS
jgi:RNA polymerase sigma-70 factor (ECF subfamily)